MAHRLRIGLTGGIASGKSTAAAKFAELGIPVIDADEAARAVVAPGQFGLTEVVKRFGPETLEANGELNRRVLRNLIFADAVSRRDLEHILHPLIREEMKRRESVAIGPYVVMVIPLLVENPPQNPLDRILVIDIDEAVQLQRIMDRDKSSMTQARAILSAQATRTDRLKAADDVLVNSGSVAELQQAVCQLHERYLSLAEKFSQN